MESIRIWLNGKRNYEAGVKLYEQFGKDALRKKMFRELPVSDYKIRRLQESLEELIYAIQHEKQDDTEKREKVITRSIQEARPESGWSKNMDEVEAALHARWKPLFVEMMDLCSRVGDTAQAGLKDAAKKIEAGRMALRILDLDDACDKIYEQRDEYLLSGKMPGEKKKVEICVDPMMAPKSLANAQRYVRDYKRKLDADPANLNYAEQLKKWQGVVEEYKELLKIK